jgi:hypothetical protein
MPSIARIWCAASRMALRPSAWRVPEWAGRPSMLDLEAADALARRDDLAALARRLRHQNGCRFAPDILDHAARRRRADLLVGGEQEDHRPLGRSPRSRLP